MKKILIALIIPLFIATACEDVLDIEPQTQIPTDEALKSANNVESTLISAYGELATLESFGRRQALYSELNADNLDFDAVAIDATGFEGQVILRTTNVFNKDVSSLWLNTYRAIAKANNVIGAIEDELIEDEDLSQEMKDEWRGESLFIRALGHFGLVRLFALPYSSNPQANPGVPLRITSLTADEKIPRSSVAEVYSQVVADLSLAIQLLPEANGNRATSWAAKAVLARVYFDMADYDNAFTLAEDVVVNGGYNLGADPFAAFQNIGNINPGGGVVFQIITGGSFNSKYAAGFNSAFPLSQDMLDVLEDSGPSDFRATQVTTNNVGTYTNKWNTGGVNTPVIRLAELYLIHAESALLKGSPDEDAAQSSYDAVRGFAVAGHTPTSLTGDDLLEAIRTERRIEMMAEGDRYHELRRLQSSDIRGLPYDSEELLLIIPLEETAGNANLEQNG